MNNRIKIRTLVTIVLGVLFVVSAGLSLYYLKTDKANENISWLLTVALFTFVLAIGNTVVLFILNRRKSQ